MIATLSSRRVSVSVLCIAAALSGCRSKKPAINVVPEDPATLVSEVMVANPVYKSRLIRGFYPGTQGWLWTAKDFAVALDPPVKGQETTLRLGFAVPYELFSKVNPVRMTTKVNGVQVDRTEYRKPGQFTLVRKVPPKALETVPALVEVSLDEAAKREDGSPLGLIVVSADLIVEEEKSVSRETAAALARQGYGRLLAERNRQLPVEKQREMMKLFHDIPIWRNMWFQNVHIEKNPLDLWMMQQVIYELRPEFIVETGTWRGGSALYWAHTLNGMRLEESRVITVDIQNLTATAAENPLWKKYVTFLQGSSTDPKIVAQIQQRVAGHRTLVVLDSDHTMKHVLNELHAYSPLVSSKSYLVVEDTHMDGVPTAPEFGPGPLAAVQTFLKEREGKDFSADLAREAFIMTFNPGGWLVRK